MARPDGEHASNIRIVGETGWSSSLESVQQTLWVHHWAKIKGNFWGGRRNFKYSVVAATRSQSVFTDLPLQQYRGSWGMWFSFPKGVFWTLSKQRANEKPFRNWFFFFFFAKLLSQTPAPQQNHGGCTEHAVWKGKIFHPILTSMSQEPFPDQQESRNSELRIYRELWAIQEEFSGHKSEVNCSWWCWVAQSPQK